MFPIADTAVGQALAKAPAMHQITNPQPPHIGGAVLSHATMHSRGE